MSNLRLFHLPPTPTPEPISTLLGMHTLNAAESQNRLSQAAAGLRRAADEEEGLSGQPEPVLADCSQVKCKRRLEQPNFYSNEHKP